VFTESLVIERHTREDMELSFRVYDHDEVKFTVMHVRTTCCGAHFADDVRPTNVSASVVRRGWAAGSGRTCVAR
jgi:hypothetical protein